MQTTLLGLAIAIILALVSALVAPLVIDWNHYRVAVETEASRLTGMTVRVNGAIEARLLPSPVITLHNVQVGDTDRVGNAAREPQLRAGTLKVELGLGPLLRGQVQASEVHLIAPQISLAVDSSGAIDWPATSPTFRPPTLSISRFDVEDGSIVLADAASGSRLVLQKLWFNGDIRSFAGPFRGEGAVVAGDELYGFRISGSRPDDGNGIKLKLAVDPSNHPLTTDLEGTLSFNHGVPQFDGTLALARPVGVALANGSRVISDPWHAGGTIRATPASASLEHLALRFGPEERALDFTGSAQVTFGAHPHLQGDVSAMQLDVDRALADPDVTRRPPLVAVRSFLQAFVAAAKLPMPAQIVVSVNALTVGGTTIDSLHGDLHFDQTGWSLYNFDFRAPGLTQVSLSGRLTDTPQGFAFSGPAKLQSTDVDMLVGWLKGRGEAPSGQAKALSAHGDVTLASDRIAVERLAATLDQENIEGRLAYNWPTDNRPARLDAELRAAKLDLDALSAFAKTAAGNDGFALPQEGTLALDIGKATFAGVDARAVNAHVKFDAGKLQIDRLSVADLGGAKLDISGRIDELSSQPRGQVTLDLDARALAGLSDMVAKFTPLAADSLRRTADRLAPAKVHAVLSVERAGTAGSTAKLHLAGTLATMRITMDGSAGGEPSHLGDTNLQINSQLDADDGTALTALLGLDRVLAVDQFPGRLTLSVVGPLNGDLRVNSQVSASGFDSAIQGTLRVTGGQTPTARLQILASAGDVRPLQKAMTGQPGIVVPVSARAALAVTGSELSFTEMNVAIGKATVHGSVAVNLTSPVGIDGDIEADEVDAASVTAMLLGSPSNSQGGGAQWSSAPNGAGAFGAMNGAVTFKLGRANFTPALAASDLRGVVHFRPSEIAVDDIDGGFAGGRVSGALAFRGDSNGLSAHAHLELAGADAATIAGSSMNVTGGLLTMNVKCDGFGKSPIGLIGSLHGDGTITLKDGQFAGLDVGAFDAAIQAADQSGAIDATKIQAVVGAALANGRLTVPQGDAALTITSGVINLSNVKLQSQGGGELSLDGAVNLTNTAINARLSLLGLPPTNDLNRARPELSVTVKGPLASPQRTLDTSALVSWLTLRAAELQTRRLESLEANRRDGAVGPLVHPDSPSVRVVPPGTVVESAVPPNLPGAPATAAHGAERLQPASPPALLDQGRSGSGGADEGVARGLPAPLVIRPLAPQAPLRADHGTASASPAEQNRRRPAPPAAGLGAPRAD